MVPIDASWSAQVPSAAPSDPHPLLPTKEQGTHVSPGVRMHFVDAAHNVLPYSYRVIATVSVPDAVLPSLS